MSAQRTVENGNGMDAAIDFRVGHTGVCLDDDEIGPGWTAGGDRAAGSLPDRAICRSRFQIEAQSATIGVGIGSHLANAG